MIRQYSWAGAVATGVVAAALVDGLFEPSAFAVLAIVLWAAVLAGLLSRALPTGEIATPAIAAGLCLAGVALLSGASIAWAADQGRAFQEAVRAAAFLGLFTLAICTATPRARRQWLAGLTVGVGMVALLGVASWLQPGLLDDRGLMALIPEAGSRLSYPIGYWNGLGAMLAVGAVLLADSGMRAPDARLRAAAVGGMPVALLGIFLTTSRGASLAVLVGLAVLVAASPNRARQLAVVLAGCVGGAVVIVAATQMQSLTDGLTDATARSQGDWLSAILAAVVLLTAMAAWLLDGRELHLRPSRGAVAGLAAAAAVAVVATIAIADPAEQFRDFREPPEPATTAPFTAAGGNDAAGNGRWQFWGEAIDAFVSAPVAGVGAGGYEEYWAQHASIGVFARRAHSMPLQQLAEFGLIGGALLLAFIAAVVVSARRRLVDGLEPDRAVLIAAIVTGGLCVLVDWSWAIPAVFAPVVIAAALLTASGPVPDARRDTYTLGLGAVALAWVAMVAAGLVLLTELKLDQSRSAAADGDIERAIDRASEARTVQPWSPEPYLQLALLEQERGDLKAAFARLQQAQARDSEDWRLALIETRLQGERGDPLAAQAAFNRALALSPGALYLREPG